VTADPALVRHRRSRPQSGFTLVELLVALTIMALALVVVPVSMNKLYQTMQYRSAIGDVVAGMRAARTEAIRGGASVPFTVDVAARRVAVGGARRFDLPEALELGLIVAEREIVDQQGTIRFYADGSSTGGSVLIRRPSGGGVKVTADWLLGRVTQEPLE
jgi:general secretion pathway protein H